MVKETGHTQQHEGSSENKTRASNHAVLFAAPEIVLETVKTREAEIHERHSVTSHRVGDLIEATSTPR